jgi:hypothetical protein
MRTTPVFVIDSQPIPGWLWGTVLKAVPSRDPYEAGRVFYRAHVKSAKNITRWIMSGLKAGYAKVPCRDEYESGESVRQWVDINILQLAKPVDAVDVDALMAGLTKHMSMK